MTAQVRLDAGEASLTVALDGAEAREWRVAGRELLWSGDPAIWNQISPILFPVVGWTGDGARVNGRHYPLRLHGFAAAQTFALESRQADKARFVLTDNEATRALYPFAFRFIVEYRLTPTRLEIALEMENRGTAPAPYAFGLHPGFRWPFDGAGREGCKVVFEKAESGEVPVIAPGGLVTLRRRPIPMKGRVLELTDELFALDALCFLDPASRALRFIGASGAAIEMALGDFPHAALWMRPGAPFLCMEAWTGYSDPEGFAGDLFEKPAMRVVGPGERRRCVAVYSYLPPPAEAGAQR
ncbi:MAG TPA: aldose 1-epimerase family protein [Roseiarcus sp.]|jgi:galactose mutarotase-like enzyme|nr:aldose 1-epimerase family protein [Roseiarcus sp.]